MTAGSRLSALVVVVLLGVGCSSPDDASSDGAAALLARAKSTLDAATSAHVVITSRDVPETGTALLGGDGVAARPGKFEGSLQVSFAGSTATVDVVSTDGQVYARLPFASGFAATDPAQFGFADPGQLMDPETGLSTLLVDATDARTTRRSRIGGDVVTEIAASIPGSVVAELLASADPTDPVDATFSVVRGSGELRRAVVTGPFFQQGVDSTFTLTLDRYGEKVDISAPSTG